LKCPFCNKDDTEVKDSRPTEDNAVVRRRRVCQACGARFTTFERVQLRELTILKKTGKRAPFDSEKLYKSINIACRKRPVDSDQIDRIVSGIQRQLESSGQNEIASSIVGEMVMNALSELDKIAYVRFASVYKNFKEAQDFEEFVGQLHEESEE